MTLLEHGAARPSARRTPVSNVPTTRLELASQGVISAYLRDISTHRPARERAGARWDRIALRSGPVRR